MTAYEVVTDVEEIAALNGQMADQLGKTFKYEERREITYPSGHHSGAVFFESEFASSGRAWSPAQDDDKLMNFLLSGQPKTKDWMEISVQLNFPSETYNRRLAGAFVRDETGAPFVAHRGKLAKGRAGLPKSKVFREFASHVIHAADNEQTSPLILISALDDPALADRLWTFAREARDVATKIGAELADEGEQEGTVGTGAGDDAGPNAAPFARQLLKLRAYFDEYAGETTSKGHGGGVRTVEHGDIVRALEAYLHDKGCTQKAQAIDLAVLGSKSVDLFEVKTSAGRTDLYTGVGQLLIHGACIARSLHVPVRKFLVLPQEPRDEHAHEIRTVIGLELVTYRKLEVGYAFEGL